jgi:hypothetical protein
LPSVASADSSSSSFRLVGRRGDPSHRLGCLFALLIYLKFDRSELITKGSLPWSQEGFDQRPFSADRHGREALEPRPNGNFRIGVEPRCQRLDGIGSNAALVDTQQEVFEERSWDVPALNLWHYEPE